MHTYHGNDTDVCRSPVVLQAETSALHERNTQAVCVCVCVRAYVEHDHEGTPSAEPAPVHHPSPAFVPFALVPEGKHVHK